MLINFINNYLEKDTSRSNKSNLIKLLISDEEKFNEINNFVNFGSFKQRLYHFINNLKDQPTCLICNGAVNWVEKDFHYRETCSSKCSGKLNLFRKSDKKINHPILSTKDEYYNYFCLNKLKITKSSILKYYPELFENIDSIKFVNEFNIKVYCYLKDINSIPVCKHCEINNVMFDTFSKGFHDYCSIKCSSNSNNKKERIKNTTQIKYGVDNIGEVTRKKALSTMEQKYGSHFSKTIQYKEKLKTISIKNYGVDHPFKSEIIKKKIKQTIKNVYGVDNIMELPAFEIAYKKLDYTVGVPIFEYSDDIRDAKPGIVVCQYGDYFFIMPPRIDKRTLPILEVLLNKPFNGTLYQSSYDHQLQIRISGYNVDKMT